MKKIRVREHWQEIIVRFTDVEVVDENDNIIESHNVYKEDIEVTESGDNGIYTNEEALRTCRHNSKLMEKIKEVEISLQNEFEFISDCGYPELEYPGINLSPIIFRHTRKDIKLIKLENELELLVYKSYFNEDGSTTNFCHIVSNNALTWIEPELLKKGKKFKVIM